MLVSLRMSKPKGETAAAVESSLISESEIFLVSSFTAMQIFTEL